MTRHTTPLQQENDMTKTTVTDSQIDALLSEQDGGDLLMTAICLRALDQLDSDALARFSHPAEAAPALTMTVSDARAECARVIADAQAMQD